MNASNLLEAVLKPRALSAASRQRSLSDGNRERRSLSPDNRLPPSGVVKKVSSPASTPVKKMTCMCSPTNHPGSFRCRYHREQRQRAVVALPTSPRGRSGSPSSSKGKESGSSGSALFDEVNRTLPGRHPRMARSSPTRRSRLQRMTLGRDLEEEEASFAFDDGTRSSDCLAGAQALTSSQAICPSTSSVMAPLPREIPTMFCQSTSRIALDVFNRSMTRMYL